MQHEIATAHKFGSNIVGIHHAAVHYLARVNPSASYRNRNFENKECICQSFSVLRDFLFVMEVRFKPVCKRIVYLQYSSITQIECKVYFFIHSFHINRNKILT